MFIPISDPDLMTIDEVGERLRLSRRHVQRLLTMGKLESVLVSRQCRRISKGQLAAYISRLEAEAANSAA